MRITHIFQPSTTHDRTEKYSPSFINAFLLFSHSIILSSIIKLSKWCQSSKWQNSKTQKANNNYNSIHLQSIAPWWNYLPLKYTINYRRTNTSLNGIQNNKSPDILANYFTLSTWTLILVMYHRNPLPQSRISNRCPSQYDSILTKTSIVLKHNTSQKSTISIPQKSKMTAVHSKKWHSTSYKPETLLFNVNCLWFKLFFFTPKIHSNGITKVIQPSLSPLPSIVLHQRDVVLLCLRFDCIRDLVWWVSVWKSGDGYMR